MHGVFFIFVWLDSFVFVSLEMDSVSSNGNVVAILIAIISFAIGLLADLIIRNVIKRHSLSTMRDSVLLWYSREKESVTANIASIETMANTICSAAVLQPEGAQIRDVDLARLCEYRLDELFSAFVENIKTGKQNERMNYLYTFQKGCRYVDISTAEVRKIHEHYIDDIRTLMQEWNPIYAHLLNGIQNSTTPGVKACWRKLFESCQSKGGGAYDCIDVEKWDELLIKPFSDYLIEMSDCKEVNSILRDLNSLNVVFVKFRGTRKYGQLFKAYAANMSASVESMESCFSFIKSAKLKCWVQ